MARGLNLGIPPVALITSPCPLYAIPFRVTQEPVKWQEHAIPVTPQSIATAIGWVEELSFELTTSSAISRLDALLDAGKDETVSVCLWPSPRWLQAELCTLGIFALSFS